MPATPARPNLVLFMPDQLRAESVGCYGHPLVRTPNIDALAQSGTRFDYCQVASPLCPVSRCDMATGLPPHVSGHRMFGNLLQPHEPNLFRYLKEGGYDVYWYGRNDLLVAQDFESSATEWGSFEDGPAWMGAGNPWPQDHPRYFSFLYDEGTDRRDYPDYLRVARAIEVLEQRESARPFALYLPLFNPHPPFFAPQGFHDLYDPREVPELRPPGLAGKPGYHGHIRSRRRLDRLDDTDMRTVNAIYLGMISYVDWLLGLVLEALERTGRDADTAVLFFSDHGEWAGDYGLLEKWSSAMDEVLVRVPFIARVPGAPAGQVAGDIVELRDLMATCLDLAGLSAGHTHFSRSLLPVIRGAPGDPGHAAFSEGGYNPNDSLCFLPMSMFHPYHVYYPKHSLEFDHPQTVSRTTMVRTAGHKLVYRPDYHSELYDVARDPLELHNVYDDPGYAGVREQLQQRILDWYVRTSDVAFHGAMPMELP